MNGSGAGPEESKMMLHRFLLPALLAPSLMILPMASHAQDDMTAGGDKPGFVFIDPSITDDEMGNGLRDDGRDVDGELVGDGVDGFLVVGRGTTEDRFILNYAYAINEVQLGNAQRAEEQAKPSLEKGPRVVVYLTDKPIPTEARGDIAKIQELANRSEIHGLELVLDPGPKKPRWAGRLLLGGDDANQVFRTRRGERNFQLEGFERVGNRISGSIFIGRAFPQFDLEGEKTGEKASFKVEFRVVVDKAPSPTNTLERTKAWKTPQAEALLLAVQALYDRDVDRFKQFAAFNSEIAFQVQGPGADQYQRDFLNKLPRNPEKLRESIDKILIFGDRAILLTTTGRGREFIFLREFGQWKLSQG
jgi:hypothetical protein